FINPKKEQLLDELNYTKNAQTKFINSLRHNYVSPNNNNNNNNIKDINNKHTDFDKEFQKNGVFPYVASSKTSLLMKRIKEIFLEEIDCKILIFSQFTSMLDIIEEPLKYNNYKY